MVENYDTDQLRQCPRCLYFLKGLPREHRCPECGLSIDRRWRVFGGPLIPSRALRPLRIMFAIPFIPLAGVFLLWLYWLVLRPTSVTAWLTVLLTGGATLFLGWCLCTRPRKFVAVGPRGVVIYHGRKRSEGYAWNRVGKASYNLLRKALDIELDGDRVWLSAYGFFRGSVWAACFSLRGHPPGLEARGSGVDHTRTIYETRHEAPESSPPLWQGRPFAVDTGGTRSFPRSALPRLARRSYYGGREQRSLRTPPGQE